jgi:hypothetical protein
VPLTLGSTVLAGIGGLTGYAGGTYGQVSLAAPGGGSGTAVPAIGLDELRGNGFLTLLAGRAPAGPREIALGQRTLHALGVHIGQQVEVGVDGTTSPMRVVGAAVFADFSVGGGSDTDLGTGAVVPASALSQPNPPFCAPPTTCYNFFLLKYRPGTDLQAAAAQVIRAVTRAGCPRGLCLVTTDQRPSDIQNYTGLRDTPLILGAVLALLAVGTLAHVLLTGVRRRRRDLAVLKTLGLLRSQLLRVVSWQASALAAAALLVGLPVGLLAGRWAWALFAGSVGVAGTAEVPLPIVLAVIPVTLLVASLLAAGPGWAAARIRPALILRAE